ncbi:MAG TPA: transglycosylase domain-containing protein [Candidatus Dormibacteraeota bacterium]|nr:transglycosylase domain-containing protein [Candidatus Dormibacteraeota bacterium]
MIAWLTRPPGRRVRAAATAAVVLAAGGLLSAHALGLDQLPDVSSVMSSGAPNDNLVFDRTGTVLLAELQQAGGQHTDVPLAAMGRWLPAATVAIDDPGFWGESGVDPGGVAGAAWADLRARSLVQTGATITQRLVRLRLYGDDRLRQAALAVRVAGAYPKARILEAYLNSLPYGNRATGAEAAAITYFQVDAAQLDLAQAALLAGLPASPGRLDPLRNQSGARERQRQVLDAMTRTRAITAEQAAAAAAEPLLLTGPSTLDVAPGFVDLVGKELEQRLGTGAVRRGGLSVVSTLDWGLQQQAVATMRAAIAANRFRSPAINGTLVAMDPRTARVLALLDAADPQGPRGQSRFGSTVPINAGGTMTTFAYTAALATRRYTMTTPIVDATPLTVDSESGGPSYRVENYDLRSHGTCELRMCLASGLNVPAIQVEIGVGVPGVVGMARALGASPLDPEGRADAPPGQYGPSLALGGYPLTALSLTAGYATLADGGVRHDPATILRVTAPDGGVVFQARGEDGRQAIDAGTAFVVSEMLADDASRAPMYGTGGPLTLPGRHVAARSGTSESFHDALTVGYTPSLVTTVWIGVVTDYRTFMTRGSDGIVVAAPAWHQFMQAALDQLRKPDEWYAPPAGVASSVVSGRPAWFLPGTSAGTPTPALPAGVHLPQN